MPGRAQLQDAFKLALSLVLFYWLALWMDWDLPKYGALAIVLIDLGTSGASFMKGAMRVVGTTAGLAIGMAGIALFAQHRLGMLVFLCVHLTVVAYFLPTSRYGYAWFVAGFLPPLIWATTYGKVDDTFHYAVFRYLETTAGIVIHTLVGTLLWPRTSGGAVEAIGRDLWAGTRKLLGLYREQLDDGRAPAGAVELSASLSGGAAKLAATLNAAYADTPSIRARRRAWHALRLNLRAFGDALELWGQSIDDCRQLDRDRLLPSLGSALDTIDDRLERIAALWPARLLDDPAEASNDADAALLEPLAPVVDRAAGRTLSHFDRAALLGIARQVEQLDLASRELLRTVRVLAGVAPMSDLDDRALPADLDHRPRWDPARIAPALLPALSFAVAFVFWMHFDPPSGPSAVSMAATASLLAVMTRMNVLIFVPLFVGTTWIVVAPIYFLVMPRLDTGLDLLALIFVYALVFAIAGTRSPPLKSSALIMFVMMTGIDNHQSYSFMGLVNGAFMLLLGFGIAGLVQVAAQPVRPEQVLARNVRRFFSGCARITEAFGQPRREERRRSRARRRHVFESMMQPVPGQVQALHAKLDDHIVPAEQSKTMARLGPSLQSIAFRFQALESAHARFAQHAAAWTEPLVQLGRQLRERMQGIFVTWSRFQRADDLDERAALADLAQRLEAQLDTTIGGAEADRIADQELVDFYTLLGSARSLVRTVGQAQAVVEGIEWDRLTEARF